MENDEIVFRPYKTKSGKEFLKRRNRTKERASSLAWYYRNKERSNANARKWANKNKELIAERRRKTSKNTMLRCRYGINILDFYRMIIEQNNACAICNKFFGRPQDRYVDHNHETGIVRSILCFNCNTGLGHFRDSLKLLEKASGYLIKHGNTTYNTY